MVTSIWTSEVSTCTDHIYIVFIDFGIIFTFEMNNNSPLIFCSYFDVFRKGKEPMPLDLETLPKEELVRMLRSMASEREALEQSVKRDSNIGDNLNSPSALATTLLGNSGNDSSNAANPLMPPPFRATTGRSLSHKLEKFDCEQFKSRIREKVYNAVKKTAHNWKNRPVTEISEELPTAQAAIDLFQGHKEINKNQRSLKWELDSDQTLEWLGSEASKYIHPVKFDGKVVCSIGQTPSVYAFASYDSMMAKYERNTGMLTLKFKTYTSGTGHLPGSDEPVFPVEEDDV